jgi:predicted metal-binding membrane protein
VTATAIEQAADRTGTWRLTAIRLRLGLVALLVALAAVAWWWTAHQMRGMDAGPWTSLGGFGWFVSVWVAMMAAMMFPSVAPTVALYARMTSRRSPLLGVVFAAGYLATWAAAGVAAYGLAVGGGKLAHGVLAWDRAGRWIAAGTLVVAAVYELTPLKDVCLGKCRSPLGALLGSWRGGLNGAFSMGVKNGAWCVGCCWALMASLFALGVMSLVWMAFVSALIAVEKLIRWERVATFGTAAILLAVAVFLVAAPHALPGLTIPSGSMDMPMDPGMGTGMGG